MGGEIHAILACSKMLNAIHAMTTFYFRIVYNTKYVKHMFVTTETVIMAILASKK